MVSEEDNAGADTSGPTTLSAFLPGDIVKVCEGEYKHKTGTVVSIEADGHIMVQLQIEFSTIVHAFPSYSIRKHFVEGDHIKVFFVLIYTNYII